MRAELGCLLSSSNRAGQYFTALIILVSLSCLLTVVVAYVHWLGEEQIEVKRFMRRTILRTLGPILVPQHFKNLDRVRLSPMPPSSRLFLSSPLLSPRLCLLLLQSPSLLYDVRVRY